MIELREPEAIAQSRRELGKRLAAFRQAADLRQRELAAVAFCDRTTLAHVEHGRARADLRFWQACDKAVGAGGALVTAFGELEGARTEHDARQRASRLADARVRAAQLRAGADSVGAVAPPAAGEWMPDESVVALAIRFGADDVETVHARIRQLVDWENQFGGDRCSSMALHLFSSVYRKLGAGQCAPGVERDMYAAVGELGEVVGWLLYDAGQHDLVRRINNEAAHLSRLAGDHSMELLIMQNMSMHAAYLGRHVEALRIARMVLAANTLSPRLESLFRVREARALAQAGDEGAADWTFRRARSLYLDGVRDDDPAWAWWINDRELAWHEAMIRGHSGDWGGAADSFQSAIELTPGREMRRQYHNLASLLGAQVRVGAWRESGDTIGRVLPYVDDVGSMRTATALVSAINRLDTTKPPTEVRDGARELRGTLALAGYDS